MTDITKPDLDIMDYDPDAAAVEVASGDGSVLDRVKKRRREVKDTVEIPIPSWGGELIAVYKVLDQDKIDEMIRNIQQRARQLQVSGNGRNRDQTRKVGNNADMDFLIDSCVGIIAWDSSTDEREEIAQGFFDMTLVPMLEPKDEFGNDLEITNPRELLMYLLKHNTISLGNLSQKVARWMRDTSIPVEDPQ